MVPGLKNRFIINGFWLIQAFCSRWFLIDKAFYDMVSGWYKRFIVTGWHVRLVRDGCGWYRRFATDVFSTQRTASAGWSFFNEVSKFLDKQLAAAFLYGHIRPLQLAWALPHGMAPIITRPHIHRFPHPHPCQGVSDAPSLPQGCTTSDRDSPHKFGCCLKLQPALPGAHFPLLIPHNTSWLR